MVLSMWIYKHIGVIQLSVLVCGLNNKDLFLTRGSPRSRFWQGKFHVLISLPWLAGGHHLAVCHMTSSRYAQERERVSSPVSY